MIWPLNKSVIYSGHSCILFIEIIICDVSKVLANRYSIDKLYSYDDFIQITVEGDGHRV